jgi:hypothetical protein
MGIEIRIIIQDVFWVQEILKRYRLKEGRKKKKGISHKNGGDILKKKVQVFLVLFFGWILLVFSYGFIDDEKVHGGNELIPILLEAQEIKFTQDTGFPFVDRNNRIQVPLRVVLERAGARVTWDQENRIAIAEKENRKLEIPIDKDYIFKNGERIQNDTQSMIIDGRTFLPIRIVMEALGYEVIWEHAIRTVKIYEVGVYKKTLGVQEKAMEIEDAQGIYILKDLEELKKALLENFSFKGIRLLLRYGGNFEELQEEIKEVVAKGVYESHVPFLLENWSYRISGVDRNLEIEFQFVYDDSNYHTKVNAQEEFAAALSQEIYERKTSINLIYKGDLEQEAIENTILAILDNDMYLKLTIENYSYELATSMGISALKFAIRYETNPSQENFVDETVKKILDKMMGEELEASMINEHEKVKRIHDLVLSRLSYTDDTKFGNAFSALFYGKTTCEGYAMLTYKLLKGAGIENRIVTNEDHAWNLVRIYDQWYHVDTTWNDGIKKNEGFYKYFNLTDAQIRTSRNYIAVEGIVSNTDYREELERWIASDKGVYEDILEDLKKNQEYLPLRGYE